MILAKLPWSWNPEIKYSLLLDVRGLSFLLTCCVDGRLVPRGVAALHALSKNIVHRDIKSFNFLGKLFPYLLLRFRQLILNSMPNLPTSNLESIR